MRPTKNDELEEAVYLWFVQKRHTGETVTSSMLRQKAQEFNQILDCIPSFKASEAWLQTFKKRRNVKISGSKVESLTFNLDAAENFTTEFHRFIEDNSYEPENIYSADEFGLRWLSLPCKTPFDRKKSMTERITMMICSNATGNDRIPLLVVGNHEEEEKSYDYESTLVYKSQEESWMTQDIFLEWYKNIFIPHVNMKQTATSCKGKVLLLLDTAPIHPSEEIMNEIDDNFKVHYLSPIAMSLQPMNQGVSTELKKSYKKALLRELLNLEDKDSLDYFLDEFSIKHCCAILNVEWQHISGAVLENAWKPLKMGIMWKLFRDEQSNASFASIDRSEVDIILKSSDMPVYINNKTEDVVNWMNYREIDSGWKPLEDEEILNLTLQQHLEDEEDESSCSENSKPAMRSRKRKMLDPLEDPLKEEDDDVVEVEGQIEQNSVSNPYATTYYIMYPQNNVALGPIDVLPNAGEPLRNVQTGVALQEFQQPVIENSFPGLILGQAESLCVETEPSRQVLKATKTVYNWIEKQPECTEQMLTVLRAISELAERKANVVPIVIN